MEPLDRLVAWAEKHGPNIRAIRAAALHADRYGREP
jgi:hypothetical protein